MANSGRSGRVTQADLETMLRVKAKTIENWVARGLPSRKTPAGRTFSLQDVRDFVTSRGLADRLGLATSVDAVAAHFSASARQVARWRAAGMPVVFASVGRKGGLYSLRAVEAWVDEQDATTVGPKTEQLTPGQRELFAVKAEQLELRVAVEEAALTPAAEVDKFLQDVGNDIHRVWVDAQMHHMDRRDEIGKIAEEEYDRAFACDRG